MCIILITYILNPVVANAAEVNLGSHPLLHVHTGEAGSGGGCYTTPVYCGGTINSNQTFSHWYGWWRDNVAETTLGCKQCGAAKAGHPNNHAAYNTSYSCGVCGTSYGGGGTCTRLTGYDLSCGCASGETIAIASLYKKIEGNSYTLRIEHTILKPAIFVLTSATWSTGESTTATVTGNGVYTLTYKYKDNGYTFTGTYPYEVTDYDMTPPSLSSINASTFLRTNSDIVVNPIFTDAFGVTGYNINGGAWELVGTFTISSNGTFEFRAKDLAGNISTPSVFVVDWIDKVAPVVDSVICSN